MVRTLIDPLPVEKEIFIQHIHTSHHTILFQVEYQCYPSLLWRPAKMEQCVIEQLLQTQFHAYIERVHKTDCQAELKRLLQHGPPIYIADPHGLPLRAADDDDNIGNDKDDQNNDKKKQHQPQDTHIIQLWFASDDTERSAKLHGAVEGRTGTIVEGTERIHHCRRKRTRRR
jgi:hypothetical protein